MKEEVRRVALVDGQFLERVAEFLGEPIDYGLLRNWLVGQGFDVIEYFHNLVVEENGGAIVKLFDWLGTNGYILKIREYEKGQFKYNQDVPMAVRLVALADYYDEIMVVTAGSGLLPAITSVYERRARKIHIVSLWSTEAGRFEGPYAGLEMKKAAWKAWDFKTSVLPHVKKSKG